MVRKDEHHIQQLKDLKDKTLAVMRGDNAERYVNRESISPFIVTTDSFETALTQLSQGQHDAVVMNHVVALKLIKQLHLNNLKIANPQLELFRQDFSFAVQEGNKALLAQLNEGLALIMSNGTAARLEQKWLSDYRPAPQTYYLWVVVLSIFLSAAVMGGLSWLWRRSLLTMVNMRTAELSAISAELAYERDFNHILLDTAANLMVVVDHNACIVQFNKTAENITGYKFEEVKGCAVLELFILDEEKDEVKNVFDSSFNGQLIKYHENHWKIKDGSCRLFAWANAMIVLPDGTMDYAIAMGTDITDYKALQTKLQAREEQLLTLINASPDLIIFKDAEGRWLEANTAILELLHLQNVDYQNKKDDELSQLTVPLYTEALSTCKTNDRHTWEQGVISRQEENIPLLEGGERIYDVIKVPVYTEHQQPKGLVVLGRDISERKKMEEELSLWMHVFEHADWGMVLCKGNSVCFERVNPAFAHALGYSREEIQGMDISNIFPEELHTELQTNINIAERLGHYCFESVHQHKNGHRFPVWIEITAVYGSQNEVSYRVAHIQNISARKKAEDRLRMFEQMVSTTQDLMAFVDTEYTYIAKLYQLLRLPVLEGLAVLGLALS